MKTVNTTALIAFEVHRTTLEDSDFIVGLDQPVFEDFASIHRVPIIQLAENWAFRNFISSEMVVNACPRVKSVIA